MYGNAPVTPTTEAPSSRRTPSSLDYIYAFVTGFLLGVMAACTAAIAFLVVTTVGLDHE